MPNYLEDFMIKNRLATFKLFFKSSFLTRKAQ